MSLVSQPIVQSTPSADAVLGLRVHTRGNASPEWIRHAALPVWRDLRAGGRRLVTLRRGWLGGPHVEMVVVGAEHDAHLDWDAAMAASAAAERVGPELSPERYLEQARNRGRLENVAPPYLPLQPEGAVRLVRRSQVLRPDHPLDELRTVVAAQLAPAAADSLNRAASSSGGAGELIDILTAVADAHVLGAGYGTFSLRSHVEALLAWLPAQPGLRGEFAQRYAAQGDAVRGRVAAGLSGSSGAGPWRVAIAYSAGLVDEHVRRGELTNEHLDQVGRREVEQPAEAKAADDHPDTEFHNTVYGSGVTEGAGAWFAGYRFLVNSVYSQLPLLGITPLHRAYACYAVAEAVDEVLGESWTQRLSEAAAYSGGASR